MKDEVVLVPRGAKGRPQVSRKRADQLIEALLIEVERINNDPLPWYDVTKLEGSKNSGACRPDLIHCPCG